jgi:hypothetical protein
MPNRLKPVAATLCDLFQQVLIASSGFQSALTVVSDLNCQNASTGFVWQQRI